MYTCICIRICIRICILELKIVFKHLIGFILTRSKNKFKDIVQWPIMYILRL